MLKNVSVARKIILLFSILSVLLIAFFTFYTYQNKKSDLYTGLDNKLLASASALVYLFDDVHDDYAKDKKLSDKEYMKLGVALDATAKEIDAEYIYAMQIKNDEKVIFTISSDTQEVFDKGEQSVYADAYDDPSDKIALSESSKKPQYDEYTDEWGTFRAIFYPVTTKNNVSYIIGIDVTIDAIQKELNAILLKTLGLGLLIFLISISIVIILSKSVTTSIEELSKISKDLASGSGDLKARLNIKSNDDIG